MSEQDSFIYNLQQQIQAEQLENQSLKNSIGQGSMFNSQATVNLIQYQVDLKEELEKIEHVLKGHYLARDKHGNEIWKEPDTDMYRPFNDYGVHLIMGTIIMYVSKHLILSDYDEETINNKMLDFGRELCKLVFLNHIEMGMTTESKKKMYPLMMRSIIDLVHNGYLRAKDGGERTSLRKNIQVTEAVNNFGMQTIPQEKKGMSLNPFQWFKS